MDSTRRPSLWQYSPAEVTALQRAGIPINAIRLLESFQEESTASGRRRLGLGIATDLLLALNYTWKLHQQRRERTLMQQQRRRETAWKRQMQQQQPMQNVLQGEEIRRLRRQVREVRTRTFNVREKNYTNAKLEAASKVIQSLSRQVMQYDGLYGRICCSCRGRGIPGEGEEVVEAGKCYCCNYCRGDEAFLSGASWMAQRTCRTIEALADSVSTICKSFLRNTSNHSNASPTLQSLHRAFVGRIEARMCACRDHLREVAEHASAESLSVLDENFDEVCEESVGESKAEDNNTDDDDDDEAILGKA